MNKMRAYLSLNETIERELFNRFMITGFFNDSPH